MAVKVVVIMKRLGVIATVANSIGFWGLLIENVLSLRPKLRVGT